MGLPIKDALTNDRPIARGNNPKRGRSNGLMFDGDALEKRARSAINRTEAAENAQKAASSSPPAREPPAREPYVVTRPGGRTVISPKSKLDLQKQAKARPTKSKARKRKKAPSRSVAAYNPSHPSVLFHRLKQGIAGRLNASSFRKKLANWLRKPTRISKPPRRELRQARSGGTRLVQHRSGLIIPSESAPFMLSSGNDMMSDLLAENQRLRCLVEEIVRTDPAELVKLGKLRS